MTEEAAVDPETWLAELSARLPAPPGEAADVGYELTAREREVLLDLARVAAHTSERWTAPLSTFLAGIAYATTPPDERAIALRALVTDLEP